jgi:uncharacterized metal-binding protein YceD (DUF177 family)
MTPPPEFSRPFDRRGITAEPVRLHANAQEREALARRFDLVAINRLEATLMLQADGADIALSGTLGADIVQRCAVSGDDLPVTIAEDIALRFVPEGEWEDEQAEEIELAAEDLDTIPYDGAGFDLGEAVAQSLALAIDPYAVGPDAEAVRREQGLLGEEQAGPLAAALSAALKKG